MRSKMRDVIRLHFLRAATSQFFSPKSNPNPSPHLDGINLTSDNIRKTNISPGSWIQGTGHWRHTAHGTGDFAALPAQDPKSYATLRDKDTKDTTRSNDLRV